MSLVFICCLYKYDVLFLCFILLIFSKLFFCDFFCAYLFVRQILFCNFVPCYLFHQLIMKKFFCFCFYW